MKKILHMILTLFLLSGCTKSPEDEPEPDQTEQNENKEPDWQGEIIIDTDNAI